MSRVQNTGQKKTSFEYFFLWHQMCKRRNIMNYGKISVLARRQTKNEFLLQILNKQFRNSICTNLLTIIKHLEEQTMLRNNKHGFYNKKPWLISTYKFIARVNKYKGGQVDKIYLDFPKGLLTGLLWGFIVKEQRLGLLNWPFSSPGAWSSFKGRGQGWYLIPSACRVRVYHLSCGLLPCLLHYLGSLTMSSALSSITQTYFFCLFLLKGIPFKNWFSAHWPEHVDIFQTDLDCVL